MNLYLLSKGSLVFWVPPYKHLRGWMAANSWNPSSFVFLFSFLFSSSFLGLAWELHLRSWERDGCMGGKLDLVRTFLVCIDDSAWFLKVVCCFSRPSLWWFSELFIVIFLAEFWGWFLGDFVGCHVWGPCASLAGDFAPKSSLNRTRFGGFSSFSSSCPIETKSSVPLDCERFGSIQLR
jgi:hypothetical protein